MKNTLLILFLLCFLTHCSVQELTQKEMVTNYYHARDRGNYNELKALISDSITITAGDYVMS